MLSSEETVQPAVQQLSEVIRHCVGLAEAKYGSVLRPASIFDVTENIQGFAMAPERGLSIVMGDVTNGAPTQWSLQFTAAIAFDITDVRGAAAWVNARNAGTAVGKYYYRISSDGAMCAVLWEAFVWSGLLVDLLAGGPRDPRVSWVLQLLDACVHMSVRESVELVAALGSGRLLSATDRDIAMLFGAMSG